MSSFINTIETFTYFWEIKSPQYCTLQMKQFIESPKFCVPQFWNSEWSLRLYPNGDSDECKGRTSCFIRRGDDNAPAIEIAYTISLSSGKHSYSSKDYFKQNETWGYPTFLPHSLSETVDKSIVIIWKMHCKSHSVRTEEMLQSSAENDLKYPVKVFAQTKFLTQTKSIQKFIDPLINGVRPNVLIPAVLQDIYPSLIVNLQDVSEDNIHVNVSLMEGPPKNPLIIICEMCIVNCAGQVLYAFEEKHKFLEGKDDLWSLTAHINRSPFKSYLSDSSSNKINLKGCFTCSIGHCHSEIISVEHIKVPTNNASSNKYLLSNEIFRLYKERKLFDFSLKVGKATFNVHKVVLGAASPVFAAMFTNDMKESKNNFVTIKDLDKETVEEMVSFMYTGSVKKLEYESAKKLFIAADKYQIPPLLDLVREIMIGLINSDVISDILIVTDAYNDKVLENEAVKFIKLNKTAVLSSPKWINFVRNNGNFAAEILRQVCLMKKRKRQ